MSYTVRLEGSAERNLKRLTGELLRSVDAKLLLLRDDPRPPGTVKLKGREGDGWRVRVGDYRILYTIDDGGKLVSSIAFVPGQRRIVRPPPRPCGRSPYLPDRL